MRTHVRSLRHHHADYPTVTGNKQEPTVGFENP